LNLVEQHIITKNHKFYSECDQLCYSSKNIYNCCLYITKRHYRKNKTYIGFKELYRSLKDENYDCVLQARKKVVNQVIRQVDSEYKSFFALMKMVKNGTYDEYVATPRYKNKVKGRNIIKFESQAIGKGKYKKNGGYRLSGTDIIVETT